MIEIKGLPTAFPMPDGSTLNLSLWPDPPVSQFDEDRVEKFAEWERIKDGIRRYRVQRWDQCLNDHEQQAIEQEKCRRFGAPYFMTVWAWTEDPRINPKTDRPFGPVPFIPYPFQVDLLRWIDSRLIAKGAERDGVISKSRDMGATWCVCVQALHGWLFRDSWNVRLISRKEELVDRKNDMDSMFAKIDFMMDRLPPWMLPNGWDPERHRLQLRMKNPANGNSISGESTTSKTLRGGRATMAIYDEAAFIPGFLGVWGTGANATNCRIAISSESVEEGPDFYRLRTGDGTRKPAVLELDWWLGHTDEWYQEMKERFGPDEEGFAREVERNPHAGFGTFIYKDAQHLSVGDFPYEPGMPLYFGIDPGFDDQCAISAVAYDPITGRFRCVEAYANRQQPPEYYASILTGLPVAEFDYRPMRVYRAEDMMDLVRLSASSFTIFGDPAGHNKVTGRSDSWYDRMQQWSLEHTPMHRGLPIVVSWQMDKRTHQGRRAALMRLIPRMDFNDTPGVRVLLQSLQEYKFERSTKDRMSEQVKPLHNEHSHGVASLEYVAVNLEALRDASVETPGVMDAA